MNIFDHADRDADAHMDAYKAYIGVFSDTFGTTEASLETVTMYALYCLLSALTDGKLTPEDCREYLLRVLCAIIEETHKN